jgi:hypothetical protein
MHTVIPLALALFAPAPDEATAARAIIDKAIQGVGGEAKLARLKAYTQKAKGSFHGPAGAVPFSEELTYNLPENLREVMDTELDGAKYGVVKVIARDKGWLRVNDGTLVEMDKDTLAGEREQMYAGWVMTLLPLKDKEFVLAPLAESKVGDRAAVGVKVTHKSHRDVRLFFDKEKGWLLRAEFRAKAPGADVALEYLYDDYHDVDGLKRPRKATIKRDGKVFVEAEVTEFKPLAKVDPKSFEKP